MLARKQRIFEMQARRVRIFERKLRTDIILLPTSTSRRLSGRWRVRSLRLRAARQATKTQEEEGVDTVYF